jgi:hypothetical protein
MIFLFTSMIGSLIMSRSAEKSAFLPVMANDPTLSRSLAQAAATAETVSGWVISSKAETRDLCPVLLAFG